MTDPERLDLDAYLARIGHRGAVDSDLPTLEALHLAHLGRIPFENIDVFLGRPVGLGLEALEAKLVRGGRGGYCFEQNTLLAAALRHVGFDVATLEARVRPPGAAGPLPRTHMLLRVRIGGRDWIADVGFGADGPLLPVPLDGTPREQPDGVHRVEREGAAVHVLRSLERGAWRDLYAFTLAPAEPVDFEVAHHFTSTHPRSPFVRTLTVQRSEPRARHVLRGTTYSVRRGDEEIGREVSGAEIPALLRGPLGLRLSEEDVRLTLARLASPPA
jgi:N-hydroxyarylamine O-acetyltransferase